jgi:hypothetical protein
MGNKSSNGRLSHRVIRRNTLGSIIDCRLQESQGVTGLYSLALGAVLMLMLLDTE